MLQQVHNIMKVNIIYLSYTLTNKSARNYISKSYNFGENY